MSILSDTEIRAARARGSIGIQHGDDAAIQPASVDFHLGTHFARPRIHWRRTGPGQPPQQTNFIRPYTLADPEDAWTRFDAPSYLLNPSDFLLATTREHVKLDSTVYARVEGKSTLGRWGLLVHTTAGFIDPGFEGPITLELRNVGPFIIELYKDMRICQVAFGRVEGLVERPYSGHYQRQEGVGLPY